MRNHSSADGLTGSSPAVSDGPGLVPLGHPLWLGMVVPGGINRAEGLGIEGEGGRSGKWSPRDGQALDNVHSTSLNGSGHRSGWWEARGLELAWRCW